MLCVQFTEQSNKSISPIKLSEFAAIRTPYTLEGIKRGLETKRIHKNSVYCSHKVGVAPLLNASKTKFTFKYPKKGLFKCACIPCIVIIIIFFFILFRFVFSSHFCRTLTKYITRLTFYAKFAWFFTNAFKQQNEKNWQHFIKIKTKYDFTIVHIIIVSRDRFSSSFLFNSFKMRMYLCISSTNLHTLTLPNRAIKQQCKRLCICIRCCMVTSLYFLNEMNLTVLRLEHFIHLYALLLVKRHTKFRNNYGAYEWCVCVCAL